MPNTRTEHTPIAGRVDDRAREEVLALANLMKLATAPYIKDAPDMPEAINRVATAAAIFSGAMIGHLILMGDLPEQQQRRIVEVMAANVRQGIKIGKDHTARVAVETTEGRA